MGWGSSPYLPETLKRRLCPFLLSSDFLEIEKSYLLSSSHPCCFNASKRLFLRHRERGSSGIPSHTMSTHMVSDRHLGFGSNFWVHKLT